REFYAKDLNYVLALESREREMREKVPATKSRGLLDWEARQKARRAELAARLERNRLAAAENGTAVMPKKPKDIKGMVWHYYQKQWVSVPVPVHVSDDCRRRCCAYLRGAVRSEYQRHADETFYFDKDDNPVLPLPVVKKKRQAGKTETVSANA
ncbi:MAG TPA: hypothetical protein VF598_00270, partial [Hymenobacter sp.]